VSSSAPCWKCERKGERALDLISAIFAMVAWVTLSRRCRDWDRGNLLGLFKGSDSVAGYLQIHQRLIYVPLVMAYCLVWTLFISRLKLSTKFLVAAPLLLDIVIDAAREPFLTIVVMVALLTWVWTLEKSAIARRKIRIVVGVFLTLCLAAAVSASVLQTPMLIKKFVNIGGGSLDDLTGDRSQKISDFLGDIRDHPLFGQLMQFSTDSRLTPHNQFVEALLRGGNILPHRPIGAHRVGNGRHHSAPASSAQA